MSKKPASTPAASKPARPRAPRKTKSTGASDTANASHDQIAEAAYHRFLQRGGSPGGDFNDWLEAERELKQRTK